MTEKFVTDKPLPTEHERELLIILIEEMAEATQRATKLLRFGRDEVQKDQSHTNGYRLGHEIGEVIEMISQCQDLRLIPEGSISDGVAHKQRQLKKYLQSIKP